jgi:hypothetical protein
MERMVYQHGAGGGEVCVTDEGSTDTQTEVQKCNTEPCEEIEDAKPWCWKCAQMTAESKVLSPFGVESILPQERFPHSALGNTFGSASNGDMCETQLYSCRKRRLTIFTNMDLPTELTDTVRPYVETLSKATDAIAWLGAIRGISSTVGPFYGAGTVIYPRLYSTYFTYVRAGRQYDTTQEIAADVSAVCECLANAKGVHSGAVAYTSTKEDAEGGGTDEL